MDTNTPSVKYLAVWPSKLKWLVTAGVIVTVVVLGFVFRNQWLPPTIGLITSESEVANKSGKKEGKDTHDHDHGHDHKGHDEGNSLELSTQAQRNVGLKTAVVKLQPFVRYLSIPSIVIGRPGRTRTEVTATLGGRVTRIYPIEGDAVEPGQPLFKLRLTHEELVKAQSELLRSAEELDVELREIRRLEAIVESGAIPGKRLLERQYQKQKIEAVLNSQRQSLLLHGLTKEQIDDILEKRTLVQGLTVITPENPKNGYSSLRPSHPFTVQKLYVKPGQYVDAGAPLCSLMDYGELYIQGRAFERDAEELVRAARENWEIQAAGDENSDRSKIIKGLKIVYVNNEVEPDSRALYFYVGLHNKVVHESKSADGHRFLTWQYKPGQRMQLRIPVEKWPDRIVLPVDAVAKEGVEYYVFQKNGKHFDRVSVQVEYQDQFSTVIANDGSLAPGDTVAISGAHQLQMALKNKAGGGVDPHAGHNH